MNTSASNDDCCSGIADATPLPVSNPPGLAAAGYRIGAQADFKAAMLDALSLGVAGPLRALQTRADDDPTIALIDAWATTLDVLTFYQERLANESWLGTATARRSVADLAALIGYAPRPGLAAEAALVFTLEDAVGAPASVTLDPGAAVQSVPGPGEQPVTFETVETIELRPEWNAGRSRQYDDFVALDPTANYYWVQTATPGVKPGDVLLILSRRDTGGGNFERFRAVKRVLGVVTDPVAGRARIDVELMLPIVPNTDLDDNAIIVLGIKASPFGHNAPRPQPQDKDKPTDWLVPGWGGTAMLLDREVEGIPPNARAVVYRPNPAVIFQADPKQDWALYLVDSAGTVSPAMFGMNARVTQLAIDMYIRHVPWIYGGTDFQTYRNTTFYVETRRLQPSGYPILGPIGGASLLLDRNYYVWPLMDGRQSIIKEGYYPSAFLPGRRWIVRGRSAYGGDATEIVTLLRAEQDNATGLTRGVFTQPLANLYDNPTVTVLFNVVRATHGETVGELLGSGNGGQPWQQFTLRQAPLTYVGAATADGSASTLEIQANGLIWSEVPSFIDAGPNDRVYTTALDANGRTVVRFGDGRTGARLPSGVNNVRAIYRKGSGAVGNVRAGQLTLLGSRPAGVRSVTNPLPAADGVDPEARDDARRNAPVTALTLDRVVSLQDYADFARAFAGVARADAGADAGLVLLSLLGPGGAVLLPTDPAAAHLAGALRQLGDPTVPLQIVSARRMPLALGATLRIDPARDAATVLAAARATLLALFGFDARDFREILVRLDVLAALQETPGVIVATITRFDLPGDPDSTQIWPDDHKDGKLLPSWIIWLDETQLQITAA